MIAPVALFVYNRLEHTIRVIETLSKNKLAEETELFIFSDGPKNEQAQSKVAAIREYINQEEWQQSFKKVTIVEAKQNQGLAKSIIGGVTELLEIYGRIIVVEDDLIISPYFLEYMNGALDYYHDDSKIWSISGYTFPMKSLKNYPHDVFYSYRGCSWGWATWENRWKMVDWTVSDYSNMIQDKKWQSRFNRGGSDLVNMLRLQMEGKIDSWAVRWVFSQSNYDMYTVYPKNSYLQNDGCDGTGTHSGIDNSFVTELADSTKQCRFEKLEIDRSIAKEFWYKYSDTLDKKIKRNLKKIFRRN